MTQVTPAPNLVEEQIALLQDLAGSLAQAQRALLQSDLCGLQEHTQLQSNLCEQWRRLRASINSPSAAKDSSARWDELSERLLAVEKQVRHLNAVYGALLRRAQRSVQIVEHLFGNALGTYHPLDTQAQLTQSPRVRS